MSASRSTHILHDQALISSVIPYGVWRTPMEPSLLLQCGTSSSGSSADICPTWVTLPAVPSCTATRNTARPVYHKPSKRRRKMENWTTEAESVKFTFRFAALIVFEQQSAEWNVQI
jgi:hypothetical protein